MRICGLIHMIELDNRIIGLKCYKHIKFFYFQNSQMNTFKRYLYQDNWIELVNQLTVGDEVIIKR